MFIRVIVYIGSVADIVEIGDWGEFYLLVRQIHNYCSRLGGVNLGLLVSNNDTLASDVKLTSSSIILIP